MTANFTRGSVALLHYLRLKVMKAVDDCNSRFSVEDAQSAEPLSKFDCDDPYHFMCVHYLGSTRLISHTSFVSGHMASSV